MKNSIKTITGLAAIQIISSKCSIGLLGSELDYSEFIIKARNGIKTPDQIDHNKIPVKKSHKKTTIFDRLEQSRRDKF